MTGHQRLWIKTQLIMRRLRPMKRQQPPPDRLGFLCFRLINLPWFDPAVMVCIVFNTLVLSLGYFGQSDMYTRCKKRAVVCLSVFFVLAIFARVTNCCLQVCGGRSYTVGFCLFVCFVSS